jgi:Uma2 family endonuclease
MEAKINNTIQVQSKSWTFDEFLAQYPDDGKRYELIDGNIIEVRPRGQHEKIAGFIAIELGTAIRQSKLPYFIPNTCCVKPPIANVGYIPDVIVLDETNIEKDPYWEKHSTISVGNSAKLVVEIVSTNWRDDYGRKLTDYEAMGIPEYWIVDYQGLGATRYIGSPKMPTISVYYLSDDGEYRVKQFKDRQKIESQTVPDFNLTAAQLFEAKTAD